MATVSRRIGPLLISLNNGREDINNQNFGFLQGSITTFSSHDDDDLENATTSAFKFSGYSEHLEDLGNKLSNNEPIDRSVPKLGNDDDEYHLPLHRRTGKARKAASIPKSNRKKGKKESEPVAEPA